MRTNEGVLVASAQLEPELVVDLHQAGQVQRGEVEAAVAALINDDLACRGGGQGARRSSQRRARLDRCATAVEGRTRVDLPLVVVASLAEDAEDGVLSCKAWRTGGGRVGSACSSAPLPHEEDESERRRD